MNPTSRHSRPPWLFLFAFALLFYAPADRAYSLTIPFSLRLTQSIDTDLQFSSGASFASEYLDGRIEWKLEGGSDAEEISRERPDTWSLCLKPLAGLSIRTGSIACAGLPARANNAVFSTASPFHAPLESDNDSLFSAGTSRKTGAVAAEIRSGIWKVAAYTALPENPDGVTWIFCSSTLQSFSEEDTNLSVALFSGNRRNPERTDDSWIVNVPDVSGSALKVAGGECVFRLKEIGGSATILTNSGTARPIKGMGRGELFIDSEPVLITSGYYLSDREYRELDGSGPSVLSRLYFAPQVTANIGTDKKTELRTGAILCHDILAGEKYWYDNVERTSGGIGVCIDSGPADISSRFMASSETMCAFASLSLRKLFIRSLQGSLAGTVTWERNDETRIEPKSIEPRLTMSYVPLDARRMRMRLILEYAGEFVLPGTLVTSAGSFAIEQSFLGSRYSTKVALRASFDAISLRPAGALSATFTLR